MTRIIAVLAVLLSACGSESNPRISTAPQVVIPNFAGTWSGNLTTDRCSDTTVLAICADLGTSSRLTLTIAQSAAQLTATMILGNGISGSTSGTAFSDGSATLDGYTFNQASSPGRTLVWRVSNISLRLSGNNLSGTMHTNITGTGLTGAIDIDQRLLDVRR